MDKLQFSTISQNSIELPKYEEKIISGKPYIFWGTNNNYPSYLWSLYLNNSILGSIINSTADFICGDDIIGGDVIANKDNETYSEIVRKLAIDLEVFGGFAIQVLRNYNKEISEIYALDMAKIRVNEDIDKVYYCDKWEKRNSKVIEYDIFNPDKKQDVSIFYFKGYKTREAYPLPPYLSAIKEIETGIQIGDFHLNAIRNNFSSNFFINFNNGTPDEQTRILIESKLKEKFCGADNAGKFLISWNDSKENSTTLERIPDDGFDEKYKNLADNTLKNICVAMRCSPVLIGMNPQNNGFSKTEYAELYQIYNKTTVKPLQKQILTAFNKIFGKEIIQIIPYKIEEI